MGAELAGNLFPGFGVGAHALEIELVDRKTRGPAFPVVTGETVFGKNGARRGGLLNRSLPGGPRAITTAGLKAGTTTEWGQSIAESRCTRSADLQVSRIRSADL
jgi:hypothetical protein